MRLAGEESSLPRLVFNGDFNWFDVDDGGFRQINERVLAHDATLGNVEAELVAPECSVGCGCAYPQSVDAETVCRSNQIHARLRATAARHPRICERLASLPMFRCYRVGSCRVGVVHGDSNSLAGWNFSVDALADTSRDKELEQQFALAHVGIFASSHTCLPALRVLNGGTRCVVNNGAAGLPNFSTPLCGIITRIGRVPSPHAPLSEHGSGTPWLRLSQCTMRRISGSATFWPTGPRARLPTFPTFPGSRRGPPSTSGKRSWGNEKAFCAGCVCGREQDCPLPLTGDLV